MFVKSPAVLLSLAAVIGSTAAKPCNKPPTTHGSGEHAYSTQPATYDTYVATSFSMSSVATYPVSTASSYMVSTTSPCETSSSVSSSVSSSSSVSTDSVSSSSSTGSSTLSSVDPSTTESSTSSETTSSTTSSSTTSSSSSTTSSDTIPTPTPPACALEGDRCILLWDRLADVLDPIANDPCCDGLTCQGGICAVPEPEPVCVPDGNICVVGALACCNTAFTCNGGQCQAPPPPTCSPRFGMCTTNGDCCDDDECNAGVCLEPPVIQPPVCIAVGNSCIGPFTGDTCCGTDTFCDSTGTGTCRVRGPGDAEPICIADGGMCLPFSTGLCCNPDSVCSNNICQADDAGDPCVGDGRACNADDTCCVPGQTCQADGLCGVPQAPNTGSTPCVGEADCVLSGGGRFCIDGICQG
ncbi:uncharacterized protein B0I36DRAFT_416976 [Microdochium trichocladiopsis]|uniref:Uncharacterized protein n=1 Tax=Microdochium trichocladiopsis TaxID=1682393 RepID=A0A9P9BLL0_9PEZI|nr:uncharacterized protein B0I36DRAFT_416976 [Microdochium trichocladiopsis]KAH7025017.1 hypothetical protein B0I36DRAFT_416976 [Microdochium trichocladiopsis]